MNFSREKNNLKFTLSPLHFGKELKLYSVYLHRCSYVPTWEIIILGRTWAFFLNLSFVKHSIWGEETIQQNYKMNPSKSENTWHKKGVYLPSPDRSFSVEVIKIRHRSYSIYIKGQELSQSITVFLSVVQAIDISLLNFIEQGCRGTFLIIYISWSNLGWFFYLKWSFIP